MMSSHRYNTWSLRLLAGGLCGVLGCVVDGGSTKASDSVDGTAQALSQESGRPGKEARGAPPGAHGRRPPGGPAFLLGAALHELDLTESQRATIEGALDTPLPSLNERGSMDRGRFTLLAAAVRTGKIEPKTVLAKLGATDPAFGERGAAAAKALETLHATLTKEQRRELVDLVTKQMAERVGQDPSGGHAGGKGLRGPAERGPLGYLLRDLDLTDGQRDAIAQALKSQQPAAVDAEAMKKRFEAGRAEMAARLESFAADTFDAKAFIAPPAGADAAGPIPYLDHLVNDLAVVVPLLDPAQREALAELIEHGPPARATR